MDHVETRIRRSISKNRIRTENRSFHCKKIEARTKSVLIMGAIKNSRSVRTNRKQSLFLQLVIPGQGSRGPIILWVGLEPLKQKTGSSRRLAPLALASPRSSSLSAVCPLSLLTWCNLLAPPARAFLSPTTHLNSIASYLLHLTSHRISSTHIGTHLTASPAAPNGGRPTPAAIAPMPLTLLQTTVAQADPSACKHSGSSNICKCPAFLAAVLLPPSVSRSHRSHHHWHTLAHSHHLVRNVSAGWRSL